MTLRLDQSWRPGGGTHGTLVFTLTNLGDERFDTARLCIGCTLRPVAETAVTGARLERSFGTYTEFALDAPLAAGAHVEITLAGLSHPPTGRRHGALAAWLELADGSTRAVACTDLQPPEGWPRTPICALPEGRLGDPLWILPWPAAVAVTTHGTTHGTAPLLTPGAGLDPAACHRVAALHQRLFPAAPTLFTFTATHDSRTITARHDPALPAEGYRLSFGAEIALAYGDADGRRHGLVTLAQLAHAARTDPRFAFPEAGTIDDAPRFAWRGAHLDVARNFHPAATVTRLVDLLAWLKMNRLHWHLTDDEGWRLPSRAFPGLGGPGAARRRHGLLPPQYADGPEGQDGVYTEAEIAAVVAHAGGLGLRVMPEIDMPGHCATLLAVVPGLVDPEEPADSYRSIQGFPNNALNPGVAQSYAVAETLLAEAARLFPGVPLHIGGDEVDAGSWAASPLAQAWARSEGHASTAEMQAGFMRRVAASVAALDRPIAAWDEAADGGGIAPENTLLFAWRTREKTAELIAAGYDVVATPGQAYYLDMVSGSGWDAPGNAWAGVASPETTYGFDPAAGLPDGPGRLVGVQAGIWTEFLHSTAQLNAMLFPRLGAIAEAGWTPQSARDWPRFAARARGVPQL